jgi:multidrug efflux system outer membrane protein
VSLPSTGGDSLTAADIPPTADLVAEEWWIAFGDTALDQLVHEALERNFNLAQATARVLESRALLSGSKAAQWPSLDIGGSASRSKFNLSQFGGAGSLYNTQYRAGAAASYEVDLWGRLSNATAAARASLLATEEDQRTVAQTLVADVVRTWLDIKELECQLTLNVQTIANFGDNLKLVQDRYNRGLVPAVDVYLARQNLLSAKALKPQWAQALANARRRLEVLAGRYPAGQAARATEQSAGLSFVALPDQDCGCVTPPHLPPVPAGLPSDLLERRPDILAAEMRLRATNATIGEAKAALYPRIALTGEAGYQSVQLNDLLSPTAAVWSLLGNLTMPLFNRGKLTAQVAAAEARTAQAAANYQGAVLNAFREVENALEAERSQQERLEWLRGSVQAARRSLVLAQERYRRGLDNLLLTLDTQRRLYLAEADLISTERNVRSARVDLILALGGPWPQPTSPDPNPSSPSTPPAGPE